MTRGRRNGLGYTIVELLMSLTVLAIGASGVVAMQKVTLATNRHARTLAVATRVAEAWADQLTADSVLWVKAPTLRASTVWLQDAKTTQIVEWVAPKWSPTRNFGPGFDALGAPTNTDAVTHFCTHLRYTFIRADEDVGKGAIRVQIRIFWRREDAPVPPPGTDKLCDVNTAEFEDNRDSLHAVYLTTAVRQAEAGRL